MSNVAVDHLAATVVATDMSNDSVHVMVRRGSELYFQAVSREGQKSVVVVLDAERTRELLEGIVSILQSQVS